MENDFAVFGGGCFWCLEAIFERYDGVVSVISGYAGGKSPNPTYKEVCSGNTGHAEVVKIEFDSEKISFKDLIEIFWTCHDPTTLNKQGEDVGTQYRSIILCKTEDEKLFAEKSKLEAQKDFDKPIVTEISKLENFYKAEESHQDYYKNNSNQPYCYYVIKPKLEKLKLKK